LKVIFFSQINTLSEAHSEEESQPPQLLVLLISLTCIITLINCRSSSGRKVDSCYSCNKTETCISCKDSSLSCFRKSDSNKICCGCNSDITNSSCGGCDTSSECASDNVFICEKKMTFNYTFIYFGVFIVIFIIIIVTVIRRRRMIEARNNAISNPTITSSNVTGTNNIPLGYTATMPQFYVSGNGYPVATNVGDGNVPQQVFMSGNGYPVATNTYYVSNPTGTGPVYYAPFNPNTNNNVNQFTNQ